MSAAEIIQEIERLPREEQERVKRFFERREDEVCYATDEETERAAREVLQKYDGLLRKLAQ